MNDSIDLVLLDIMMLGIDGLEECCQIRKKYKCPIIFISALSEEEIQLKAFELGADDYISKPFLPSVLYAKCNALCKRLTLHQSDMKEYGKLRIDYLNHIVWINNEEIVLTHKEYLLIELLTKNNNRLLSRERIFRFYMGSRVLFL